MSDVALAVRNLATHFSTRAGLLKAVDGVSFEVRRGEILGIVGESGSGKSVTGYSVMRLVEAPGRIVSGKALLGGIDLLALPAHEMRKMRGAKIAMVFQDPMMTLNPVLTIGRQMVAAVRAHANVGAAEARRRAGEALAVVGIPAPFERLDAYPHQLSGGMRQRVAIATALLNRPAVIVADEPTTALDVSIQGQILAEVKRLARETGTAFIWISHDLAVVANLADRIAIMYAGRIVEEGRATEIIAAPRHPYARGLLESIPSRHEAGARLPQIDGQARAPIDLPPGCPFRPRCGQASSACHEDPPMQREGTRGIACHHPFEARVRHE
jgi:peptide/nickel transport system ATP-binding protein